MCIYPYHSMKFWCGSQNNSEAMKEKRLCQMSEDFLIGEVFEDGFGGGGEGEGDGSGVDGDEPGVGEEPDGLTGSNGGDDADLRPRYQRLPFLIHLLVQGELFRL